MYIVAAVAIMLDLLVMKPHYTWPGLLIALSGLPIYQLTKGQAPGRTQAALSR